MSQFRHLRNDIHYAHIPLDYQDDIDLTDRSSFGANLQRFRELIIATNGDPIQDGQYLYPHYLPNKHYL